MIKLIKRIYKFISSDIWDFSLSEVTKRMYALIATTRVIYLTTTAFKKNRILSQAASLAYTSLLALGPLVALVIISSTLFLKKQGSDYVYAQIIRLIEFTMPVLGDNSQLTNNQVKDTINPQILEIINKIYQSTTSLSIFGTISIIITCIFLFSTMENAFNHLWGVSKQRKWIYRIVFYWAMTSLGSALGIFGMTFLASSQLSHFFETIPYFEYFSGSTKFFIGFAFITLVLSFAYKFLPNANVRFIPALCGAIFATTALVLNNKLSFLYVGMLIERQNFYGYLAVLPLALFSLYIFWAFVLIGAQISFSVQNLDMLSNKFLWDKLSNRSKNLVCLAIFSDIARNFLNEDTPPRQQDLALKLKLPRTLISSCIGELIDKNLIDKVESKKLRSSTYKPAIPPESINLSEFFDRLNSNREEDDKLAIELSKIEPSIKKASLAYNEFKKSECSSMKIKEIL